MSILEKLQRGLVRGVNFVSNKVDVFMPISVKDTLTQVITEYRGIFVGTT